MPVYDGTPAHAFLRMFNPKKRLAPGDPARMAARIIADVDVEPASLRIVLGSQALESTLTTLRERISNSEAPRALAASTDFPLGVQRKEALRCQRGPVTQPEGRNVRDRSDAHGCGPATASLCGSLELSSVSGSHDRDVRGNARHCEATLHGEPGRTAR